MSVGSRRELERSEAGVGPIGRLATRRLEPELMDDPSLGRERHEQALEALARINRVSLAAWRVWREVRRMHDRRPGPVRVLDVACGGGDVAVRLVRLAARHRLPVTVDGCDVSAVALDHARALMPAGSGSAFHRIDVTHDELPTGYDLVCCSLFLHHLPRAEAVALLVSMARATGQRILVQDLRRSPLGWAFAWVGVRLLTRSDVARADGVTSVEASFTLAEARALCADAGLPQAEVRPCWPQRYIIRWGPR